MRILVFGAGVLGSLLAYSLDDAGHEVTLLARGARYEELNGQGLVIRHYLQRRTTVSRLNLIQTLNTEERYDVAFAVLQRTQVDDAVDVLAKANCGLVVLVGNNGMAQSTQERFLSKSSQAPAVLFGFLGAAGRRENGRVISVHKKRCHLVAGALDGSGTHRGMLEKIFGKASIALAWEQDIDAWLKYHLAVVVPIARAVYWAKGNLRAIARDHAMLKKMITAVREAMAALRCIGIRHTETEQTLEKSDKKLGLLLRIILLTPLGRLMAGDHAMSAKAEMAVLGQELDTLLDRARPDAVLTAYDFLKAYR